MEMEFGSAGTQISEPWTFLSNGFDDGRGFSASLACGPQRLRSNLGHPGGFRQGHPAELDCAPLLTLAAGYQW